MKKTFTILLFAASLVLSAQISTTRMNDLKLGMSLSEVESTLGKPLELTKGENDWGYVTKISNKGAEFSVRFIENQNESGMTYYSLYEVETTSAAVKTLSKVGIGSSLDDLWKAYKNYSISIWKSWDDKSENYSTNERVFQLQDMDASTVLYFHLKNDKVYKISLNYFEGC